ncbi:MAG: hypothetical protein JW987_14805 [Anaerolineaceae bacterium]|nr:hypothetical protein [Anaerolineaceae bacterium]
MKNLGWLFLIIILLAAAGCSTAAAPVEAPVEGPLGPTPAPASTEPAMAAPEPTLTSSPAPLTGAACVVGAWQPEGLRAQMERSLGASSPGAVVESVTGQVVYRFSAEGQFELAFEQFEVKLGGEVNGKSYHTGSLLNGSATARYHVEDGAGQLLLSDFGGEGVRMTVTVNDQPLFEENLSAWPAFFASLAESVGAGEGSEPPEGQARLTFTCLENRLVITRGGQQPAAELELARMP